jgi:hypothetical protein
MDSLLGRKPAPKPEPKPEAKKVEVPTDAQTTRALALLKEVNDKGLKKFCCDKLAITTEQLAELRKNASVKPEGKTETTDEVYTSHLKLLKELYNKHKDKIGSINILTEGEIRMKMSKLVKEDFPKGNADIAGIIFLAMRLIVKRRT